MAATSDAGRHWIRSTIRHRLKQCRVVAKKLHSTPSDDEHVHQLRIATRRADAALRLFAPSLPPKPVRRMRRRLQAVRRAAGDVRNLDVLLQRLAHDLRHSDSSDAGEAAVIAHLQRIRRRTVRRLLKQLPRLLDKRYRRLSKRLTRQVDDEPARSKPLRPLRLLQPLADQFTRAGARDLSKIANLHQLRISGKRVRYALEILRGQIPARQYALLQKALKQLQEAAGTINDHHTAILLLGKVRKRCGNRATRRSLKRLITNEQQHLASRHAAFLKWWETAEAAQRNTIRNCSSLAAS
ncbi:MAG: CHAD domain-containing protein [Maioricimonas sp. JB049]